MSKDMSGFPGHRRRTGLRLQRAHHKSHKPWWFASAQGRFDLALPLGTLNLASTKQIAVREALGAVLANASTIPATVIAGRRVSTLELPSARYADFTSGKAAPFGIVPGDVSGPSSDYGLTQQWASAMNAAGFGGIRSRSRFGSGTNPFCFYVFGEAGQHEIGTVFEEVTMREVFAEMPWVSIEPTPSSTTLIIDP